MKRFFQPIEKEGSKKKPSLSASECFQEVEAKAEDERKEEAAEDSSKEPLKFLTWNANSFLLRAKNNWPELSKLVEKLDPDVIAIQEVRMPAAGSKGAPKNPGELKDDTSSSRDEKQTLMRAISSPPFRNYHVWWSLADTKYGGTALFVKKHLQPKVFFSLDRTASKHEPDGRVILADFKTVRLLNTYVPNNGWKDDETSFKRRRKWDKRMLEFVLQSSDKPLIWCGDLNVSHQEIDVSHPDFFRNAKQNGYIPPNKEDRGQPGFTLAERQRFSTILTETSSTLGRLQVLQWLRMIPYSPTCDGHPLVLLVFWIVWFNLPFALSCLLGKLIDAYRFLHKEQDMECGFSWSGNPVGKYRGKRMRIDYFIVSEKLKDRIASCEMHGQGIELEGFYGSDHCPLSLELLPETPESNPS